MTPRRRNPRLSREARKERLRNFQIDREQRRQALQEKLRAMEASVALLGERSK